MYEKISYTLTHFDKKHLYDIIISYLMKIMFISCFNSIRTVIIVIG